MVSTASLSCTTTLIVADDVDDASSKIETIRASTAGAPGLFGYIFRAVFGPVSPIGAGPLVTPGVYRTYGSIYEKLALIPSHHPPHVADQVIPTSVNARTPYRVAYHIWKPQPQFKKSDPPPPDFRIAIVNAREIGVPTIAQLSGLFDSVPVDATAEGKNMFHKLKDGHRNVIVAVVESGVTSFLKFGDSGFADEALHRRNCVGAVH